MGSLTNDHMTVSSPIKATSELNNLLQIIGGTTELLENIWEGTEGSDKYLRMLRTSVERAANITAQLVEQAGGVTGRVFVPLPSAKAVATPAAESKRARILVVDDEPMGLTLYQEFLANAGYEAVTAGSGFDALDIMVRSGNRFDVVVLDLTMPFMDGEETFRRMRAIDASVRVILTTGYIHESRLQGMFADGLSGYMRKPLPPDEVLEEIERALGTNQTAKSLTTGGIVTA
ncbi:MAG: response regulator [Verrucomicrobiota bacterium]|nr:response regulator [Verrucomicrobiota bacterium]